MADPLVDATKPLDVALMTSRGGPRLRYLLEDDENRGDAYEIVCCVVNDADADADERLEAHGVPVEVHDIYDFYDERGAELSDMDVRAAFDERLVEAVDTYGPDLVVCSSYLHVLTKPFLERFFPRILNAHHADLTVRDETGTPVYTGLRAVEDAIHDGEPATRETVHVATETVDTGPIVARSRPYEVHRDLVADAMARGDEETLSAYVFAHRRWMLEEGGGPTLAKAIELVADGRVTYESGETYLDGERGYYQLGRGPVHATPPNVGDGSAAQN